MNICVYIVLSFPPLLVYIRRVSILHTPYSTAKQLDDPPVWLLLETSWRKMYTPNTCWPKHSLKFKVLLKNQNLQFTLLHLQQLQHTHSSCTKGKR